MTDNEPNDSDKRSTLKKILGGVGILGVFGLGRFTERVSAQEPAGQVGPWELGVFDRVRLLGRTSDPSSPDNGTFWYREDE